MFEKILDSLHSLQIGSNTAYDYMLALAVFIGLNLALKLIQWLVLFRLRRLAELTKTDFDDVLIKIFSRVKPPFYFLVSLYFSIKMIEFPEMANQVIYFLFLAVLVFEVIMALSRLADYVVDKYLVTAEENGNLEQAKTMASAAMMVVNVVLWTLGIVLVLSNMGINITSLVASLGIGGLAVALAAQNILSDIFSSFSIYVDKPFRIGDFIVVGTDKGTVEQIGMKSTRIRTLNGEQLIISNRELTGARVQNFKKLERRRGSFTLGLTYGTPKEKLEKVPEIIKEIISKQDKVEFDRCHFVSYGDFSLNFEIIFFFNSADYAEYMDVLQQINFEIYDRFAKEGLDFAFPTQTIQLQKE